MPSLEPTEQYGKLSHYLLASRISNASPYLTVPGECLLTPTKVEDGLDDENL